MRAAMTCDMSFTWQESFLISSHACGGYLLK